MGQSVHPDGVNRPGLTFLVATLLFGLAPAAAAGRGAVDDAATPSPAGSVVSDDCVYNGIKLHGKVKVVDAFPDLKVKVVDAFPDLKVKHVDAFPDRCGEWRYVDAFPDFTIKYVDAFPDVKIKHVEAFPGVP